MSQERNRQMLSLAINNTIPENSEVLIWWLGQSGFIIKSRDVCLAVDPYLSTTLEEATKNQPWKRHIRMGPLAVYPNQLHCIDYILCSHGHRDHYDPATIDGLLQGNPNAKLIIPPAIVPTVKKNGHASKEIIGLGVGEVYAAGTLTIQAVKAKHDAFDWTPETGYPYEGFLIDIASSRIYFAGDTVCYEGMSEELAGDKIDLAILPINGCSEELLELGFASNMTYEEAANLCHTIGAEQMIPCHYDMFTINTEQVGRFVNYANTMQERIRYWIPVVGDVYSLTKVEPMLSGTEEN
ncbi:MBL fold metallo-hydrolase [Marasmitruncus massiliensis]|uniref:MBL fold metallo-hydrolase n=1 Tax=Marasmitruncus massiliensis TaxID=1944642 RepID=UPI000C7ABE0A|nr:MBL fold metallo-hydrolase [Marasmitruncus massiliensis]